MKKTHKYLLNICIAMIIICFININIFAQGADIYPPKVVKPSPTAAALAKYGQIPVSYSSGIPEISIPLYTIEGKTISLPIFLSYHAGGFKVSEVSSPIGLGWSLNAGGMVTRIIHGYPDEFEYGYFNQYNYWEDNIEGNDWDGTEDNIVSSYYEKVCLGKKRFNAR